MPKDFTKKSLMTYANAKKRLKKCKVGIFTWFLFSYLFCDLLVRKDHLIFFEGYRSTSHSRAHDKHLQIYTHLVWYGTLAFTTSSSEEHTRNIHRRRWYKKVKSEIVFVFLSWLFLLVFPCTHLSVSLSLHTCTIHKFFCHL